MTIEESFLRYRNHGDVKALGDVFDAVAEELALVAAHLMPTVLGIGSSNSGSDYPNPTQPQSHPAATPSTDLLPSQPPGHFARNPTP